jgi:hypothetical protein
MVSKNRCLLFMGLHPCREVSGVGFQEGVLQKIKKPGHLKPSFIK